MARKTAPTLLSLCMLMPGAAAALGLGDIHLHSALGQPLDAEIDLTAVAPDEVESIRVTLAPHEVFSRAGVDFPSILSSLTFSVARSETGRHYIDIASRSPIREPYLDFLVEVSWPNGRIVREYTILLDPPDMVRAETPPAVRSPRAEPTATASAPRTAVAAPSAGGRGLSYGPVKKDETLWAIAQQMRTDPSITIQQVMVALVKANPQAFYDGNMNRLKAGYVLRLDDPSLVAALTRDEAIGEVARQNRAWQDYKQGVAGEAAERPTLPTEPAPERSAGDEESRDLKLLTPKPETETEEQQPSEETPAGTATDKDELEPIKRDLMLALEGAEALQRENQELHKRMQEMEAQLASMQRLLSLKSNELTAIQERPDAAPSESVPKPAEPVPPADEAPTSFIDHLIKTVTSNPLVMAAGGVVVASLLFIGLLVAWRRRSGGNFQESILTGGTSSMLANGEGEGDSSLFSDLAVSGMSNTHAEDNEVDPLTEAEVYIAYGRYKQAAELLTSSLARHPERPEILVKLLEVHHADRDIEAFEERARQAFSLLDGTGPLWDKVVAMGRELQPENLLFAADDEAPVAEAEAREPAFREEDVLDIGLDMEALAEEMESSGEGAGDFDLDLDFAELEPGQETLNDQIDIDTSADDAFEAAFRELDLGEEKSATSQVEAGVGGEPDAPPVDEDTLPDDHADEGSAAAGVEAAHTLDFDAGFLSDAPVAEVEPALKPEPEEAAGESAATEELAEAAAAEPESDDNGLEFDLGDFGDFGADPLAEASSSETDDNALEFDLGVFESPEAEAPEPKPDTGDAADGIEAETAGEIEADALIPMDLAAPGIDADDSAPVSEASDLEAEAAADQASPLEFDLGALADELPPTGQPVDAEPAGEQTATSVDTALDLDFSSLGVSDEDLEAIGVQAEDERAAAQTEHLANADESLEDLLQEFELDDLVDDGADTELEVEETDDGGLDDPFAEMDTVATKLDLARAYIDMGDAEGARRILDDVASEGDADQQQEAKALLGRIA